jgi:hypothetical protein
MWLWIERVVDLEIIPEVCDFGFVMVATAATNSRMSSTVAGFEITLLRTVQSVHKV